MTLVLPNLDDRTYGDLVAEAKSLLPSLAPEWTDFNPSDPGITLIELFAWLTEMLLFRVNRLPEANLRTFLTLLNGPTWIPGPDLTADVRSTVLDLRRRLRAVTGEDYELLAREASPQVLRARAVARRNLDALAESARTAPRPGFVSVIVVPARSPSAPPDLPPLPGGALLQTVHDYLEPRRLLTVRNVVVGPIYVPIQPSIVLAGQPDVPVADLRRRVKDAIDGFLDPLTGGPDQAAGSGWPFGRDVYVSEIFQLLEGVPGVDHVTDVRLASVWPDAGSSSAAGSYGSYSGGSYSGGSYSGGSYAPPGLRTVPGTPLWHESGDPIGVGLEAHHLPWSRLDWLHIVVGTAFLPIRLKIDVLLGSAVTSAVARQRIQAAVLPLLHPLLGGPDGSAPRDVKSSEVSAAALTVPDVAAVTGVTLDSPPDRLFQIGTGTGVHVAAGELVDWSFTITVS
ncbi:MAG TPA: baseplate J/gp47 family protein [Thermoanaerobaculia bacterium]|nr:baseplate J/gp47 family protein [Thermoanaerobaculia bacterium]